MLYCHLFKPIPKDSTPSLTWLQTTNHLKYHYYRICCPNQIYLSSIRKLITRRIYLPNCRFCSQTSKKLCYQTREGLRDFFMIPTSQHYPYSLPFFQNYYKCPFYFPSFSHLPRLIILFIRNQVVGTSILKI